MFIFCQKAAFRDARFCLAGATSIYRWKALILFYTLLDGQSSSCDSHRAPIFLINFFFYTKQFVENTVLHTENGDGHFRVCHREVQLLVGRKWRISTGRLFPKIAKKHHPGFLREIHRLRLPHGGARPVLISGAYLR